VIEYVSRAEGGTRATSRATGRPTSRPPPRLIGHITAWQSGGRTRHLDPGIVANTGGDGSLNDPLGWKPTDSPLPMQHAEARANVACQSLSHMNVFIRRTVWFLYAHAHILACD
jgi:hypothetical protein